MLRFEISKNNITSDTKQIPYSNVELIPDGDSVLAVFYYDDECPVRLHEPIFTTAQTDRDNIISETFNVESIDNEEQTFTLRIPKTNPIEVENVTLEIDNNVGYFVIMFTREHQYDPSESAMITVRFEYDGELIEAVLECTVVDSWSVRWKVTDDGEDYYKLLRTVFRNDHYELIDPITEYDVVEMDEVPAIVRYGDPMYIRVNGSPFHRYEQLPSEPEDAEWTEENTVYELPDPNESTEEYIRLRQENGYLFFKRVKCEGPWIYYQRICEEGDISYVDFLSPNLIIDNDITLSHDIARLSLILPMQQMFDTRTRQEELVEDLFFKDEEERAINNIPEMEKYCYNPVFPIINNGRISGYADVMKIKFNLHFRQHRGDDWTVEDGVFWNGVDNDSISLLQNVRDLTAPPDKAFFSYQGLPEKQSDLLTYLGFKDTDVRYQKSKLKKSFLRLSFYDSDRPSSQHLLGYATIYMDGGRLYRKYMSNVTNSPYTSNSGEFIDSRRAYIGARVNREPDWELVSGVVQGNGGDSDNDRIEEFRLSSQIVVEDKRTSVASSEGFYLYLWADNDKGLMPSDIYMKAEFNHAGYGRTIPFMMPYFNPVTECRVGIKTFEEILTDWRTNNEYDIKTYNRYSYVKMKYVYDYASKKHVYYLDNESYGDDAVKYSEGDNEWELNLYEAKVSMFSSNDKNPNTLPYGVPRRHRRNNNC